MNEHIKNFNARLISVFEAKAAEFTKHSQENQATAKVTAEIAGLYTDLIEVMRR